MRKKVIEEEVDAGFDWRNWVGVGVIVLLVVVAGFFFLGYNECGDATCFYDAMRSCDRVKFVGGDDMIFEYKINGMSGGMCEVDVKLLQANLGTRESERLEGQEMSCFIEEGLAIAPESDIGNCHGRLKEELQELIIEKMQNYLIENLGQLNFESGLPGSLGI